MWPQADQTFHNGPCILASTVQLLSHHGTASGALRAFHVQLLQSCRGIPSSMSYNLIQVLSPIINAWFLWKNDTRPFKLYLFPTLFRHEEYSNCRSANYSNPTQEPLALHQSALDVLSSVPDLSSCASASRDIVQSTLVLFPA